MEITGINIEGLVEHGNGYFRCWPKEWIAAAKKAGLAQDGNIALGEVIFKNNVDSVFLCDALEIFATELLGHNTI